MIKLYELKKSFLKVWWHAAALFVYFIFLLHYIVANGYTFNDEAGVM